MTVVGTGWDENFVSTVFYGGATGSGTPVVTYPNNVGGLAEAAKGVKLMWLPNDNAADPAFIAYNAIPWSSPSLSPSLDASRQPSLPHSSWCVTAATVSSSPTS